MGTCKCPHNWCYRKYFWYVMSSW